MDSEKRYTTNESVNQALEDLVNRNRPITSKATINARITEVMCKNYKENAVFEEWARRTFKVP